jgi:hypothetical protein
VLKQAATTPAFLPPPPRTGRGAASGSGTHQQQLNLVDTLAALRWVGACAAWVGGQSATLMHGGQSVLVSVALHCKLQTAASLECWFS